MEGKEGTMETVLFIVSKIDVHFISRIYSICKGYETVFIQSCCLSPFV